MSPSPTVSVIIPNRDRSEPLRRAVDSVLTQKGVDFELLVVDDASVDPPHDVHQRVTEAGHRVLIQPRRRGPGPARNWGAREARGRYVAFLDSDDHWLPGKLATQLASLQASGCRIGQVEEIWYRHGVRVNPPKPHRMSGGDLFGRSLRAVCVSSSSVVLERSLFEQSGGFNEELFVCEDYDLWCRVAANELFDLCLDPLVMKYGGHPDQLSAALPAMDRFRIRALVLGLRSGAFSERWPQAQEEALRKIRILAKGSAKHGRDAAVLLCHDLTQSVAAQDWAAADGQSGDLMRLWPIEPEVIDAAHLH